LNYVGLLNPFTGAVRISVGMVTNFNDVQAVLSFARGLLS